MSTQREAEKLKTIDIAEFFLSKDKMSPKKLQKLVYYSYAWFIALNNDSPDEIHNKLFDEPPRAWAHGPVFPSLYSAYKNLGWHDIPKHKPQKHFQDTTVSVFLNEVWQKFGKFSADELEYMTHRETPWQKARDDTPAGYPSNAELSDKDIYLYYNSL